MQNIHPVNWHRNLGLLWFSQLLVMAGFSAMIPFIPLFMHDKLGIVDEGKLGIYASMFTFFGTFAYAIFCPIWGTLSDKFGVRIMLLRGTFLTAFIYPAMGYVHSAGMLILLRFLSAACAGTTAASQILIARTVPDNRQGFAQGTLGTAYFGGAMLGNVAGGMMIYYFDYLAAFWFCGILYFFAGISCIFTQDEFVPKTKHLHVEDEKPVHIRKPPLIPALTYSVWIMLLLFLMIGLLREYESPYIAMKIKEFTGDATASYWTGIISATVASGAILSGVFIGFLADRIPPVMVLIPGLALSAVLLVWQGVSNDLWSFGISRTLLAVVGGGLFPVLQKMLSVVTPKRKRGSVFGLSTSFNQIGVMLAAVFSGWTILGFGLNGVFYTSAALLVISLPFFIKFMNYVTADKYYLAHMKSK